MKNLKKVLFAAVLTVAIAATTTTASAQYKGEMGVGAQFGLAFDSDFTFFGIGAKFQYNPANNLRLEPSFNYYFPNDNLSLWDINFNVHYLIGSRNVIFYPLAGIGAAGATWNSHSDTNFLFNLGAGADFLLGGGWLINTELKARIADGAHGVFSVGLGYKF